MRNQFEKNLFFRFFLTISVLLDPKRERIKVFKQEVQKLHDFARILGVCRSLCRFWVCRIVA